MKATPLQARYQASAFAYPQKRCQGVEYTEKYWQTFGERHPLYGKYVKIQVVQKLP